MRTDSTGSTGSRGAGGSPTGTPQPGSGFDWKALFTAAGGWLGGPYKVIACVACGPWKLLWYGDNVVKRVSGALLLIAVLLAAWEGLAFTRFSQFALHPLVAVCCWPAPSFEAHLGVLPPCYDDVTLVPNGLVADSANKESFAVKVNAQAVKSSDIKLAEGGLVVPADAFEWGTWAGEEQTVELRYKRKPLGEAEVAVAPRPVLIVRVTEAVHEIDGSGVAQHELERHLRRTGAKGPMYVVEGDGVDVVLPEEVANVLERFSLLLSRGSDSLTLPVAGMAVHISAEELLLGSPPAYGRTYATLCYNGKPLARVDFVLSAAPLVENRNIPRAKLEHWDYDAATNADEVHAHDDLIIEPKHNPPHYNLHFEPQRVPGAKGLWIMEMQVRDLGRGTMALAIREVLELVMPAGVGEHHAELKLHEQLFAVVEPAERARAFEPWNGVVTLNDDLWHTLTLVVRVWWAPSSGLYCWRVKGYVDDVCIGETVACSEKLPASFVPEFRLRGARGTTVSGVRVYSVPA